MRKFIGVPRQGDHRRARTREICAELYERDHRAAAGLARRRRRQGQDQGRLLRQRPRTRRPSPSTCAATAQNKVIQQRLKDPDDELEIVIVKVMLLTGFDSPPLHTMYLDRPLKGALLMQALARVNRTFRGKQDGLLVAYAPLAENLHKALAEYTATDQTTKPRRHATSTRRVALVQRPDRRDRDDDAARATTGGAVLAGRSAEGVPERGRSARSNYLRDPRNARQPGRRGRADARRAVPPAPRQQLRALCALCSGSGALDGLRARHRSSSKRSGSGWPSSTPRTAGPAASRSPRTSSCTSAARPPASIEAGEVTRHLRGRRDAEARPVATSTRVHRAKASRPRNPQPGHRGAARADRAGDAQGHPAQHRPPAGVLRPADRADAPVHQPAAHLRRGHRGAGRDGQGGRRGRAAGASTFARR